MYFYTVARHYLTLDSDPQTHMNSSFSVETAVVSSDKNTVVQGATYHFAKNGVSNTATVRAYLTTGTEGNYVTYVEAFIPNDALIVERFKPYFTDNHLNDGYDLRFGVAWRTKGDTAPVFGTKRAENEIIYDQYWEPLYRHGFYSESNAKKEYFYIDKNDAEINRGLRWSQYVAADRAIDGDVSDWADYDAAAGSGAVNVMTTEIGDGRYAKYRGYFGDDGLYVSVEAKINNFIAGNYELNRNYVQDYVNGWHKDTAMEIHIKTSSGSGTKDFAFNVTYGFNTTLAAHSGKTLDGRFSLMESAMTYKKDTDGKYYVVVEAFVPNEILYAISGQDGVKPHVYNWIFGTNNDASKDAVTTTEIFKFVEGGSGEVGANASSWVEKWIGGAYSSNNIKTWSATAA